MVDLAIQKSEHDVGAPPLRKTATSRAVPQTPETIVYRTDAEAAMKAFLTAYLSPEMDLYDVGCGTKPFAEFLKGRVRRHIGVDIDNGFYGAGAIDIFGSADDLPLEDKVADAVLSSQVIEHVPDPGRCITEAYRVLKPGGYLFLSFPFLYPVHAPPYDFSRLTIFGVNKRLKDSGFEILESRPLGGFWYVMGVLGPLYLRGVGPLRKLGLAGAATWLVRTICKGFHRVEGRLLKSMKKDALAAREFWAVGYVIVARRP